MLAEQFEVPARELQFVVRPLGVLAHFPLAEIDQRGPQFLVPVGQYPVRVPFIAESPEGLRSPHLLLAHSCTLCSACTRDSGRCSLLLHNAESIPWPCGDGRGSPSVRPPRTSAARVSGQPDAAPAPAAYNSDGPSPVFFEQ